MDHLNYAEINLDNIRHNYRLMKNLAGPSEIMAVLKANAYGHGAGEVFRLLLSEGCERFAVANYQEAAKLRDIDGNAEIFVFGCIPRGCLADAAEKRLTLSVFSENYYNEISKEIRGRNVIKAHIKVNTGFNRLGFDYNERELGTIEKICKDPAFKIEGIFSHLRLENEKDDRKQSELLESFVCHLESRGVFFKYRHIADSISTVCYNWARLDMVRLGAVLYGLKAACPVSYSISGANRGYDSLGLRPAMRFFASVVQIRELEEGEHVSYDESYTAGPEARIAVISAGYADGYPRSLSNKGYVLVNGRLAPVVGLICMDQSIIDITGIDVSEGDAVILFDTDSDSPVSVSSLAALAGTNKNEIVSSLANRVPRIFINNGERYTSTD